MDCAARGWGRRSSRESVSPMASRTLGPSRAATHRSDQPGSPHRAADAAVNAPNQSQGRGTLARQPMTPGSRPDLCPGVSHAWGPGAVRTPGPSPPNWEGFQAEPCSQCGLLCTGQGAGRPCLLRWLRILRDRMAAAPSLAHGQLVLAGLPGLLHAPLGSSSWPRFGEPTGAAEPGLAWRAPGSARR